MSDEIKLLPVRDLYNKKFLIPNYQRGYRWGEQQVKDLLDDIAEFMEKADDVRDDFYCLQPLVVRETVASEMDFIGALPKNSGDVLQKTREAFEKYVEWEVIDGQQRLTTIYILLSFLDSQHTTNDKFSIRYATRNSQYSLENIADTDGIEKESQRNIDVWHMKTAYGEINTWFSGKEADYIKRFKDTLLNRVQFIWYESSEDAIKVFTRLNIGKIGLTNSELIKALFLNKSNFLGDDTAKIRLRQIEIATRWDQIETTLQDNEFWLFLNKPEDDKPTRIDFIFDLVCELKMLDKFIDESLLKNKDKLLGKDGYRTFRYFNAYFKSEKTKLECNAVKKSPIEICWDKVDDIFAAFREWFDDLQLYHYVGFLVDQKIGVSTIYNEWKKSCTKSDFLEEYLIPEIKKKIQGCNNLDRQYEISEESDRKPIWKTECRPLLLLHNLQTVINQNTKQSSDNNSTGVFYKFPFHLYKTEGWDIEHIDSNSPNDMDEDKAMIEFLANEYSVVSTELQKKIIAFCKKPVKSDFDVLRSEIDLELGKTQNGKELTNLEKNKIWNFALLDSTTNRSYGNAIFSAKRRIIIGKDKGKYIPVPHLVKRKNQWEIVPGEETDAPSSFIPPCTRQVFLKYYSIVVFSPNYWLKPDAEAYRNDIFTTLKDFGITVKEEG